MPQVFIDYRHKLLKIRGGNIETNKLTSIHHRHHEPEHHHHQHEEYNSHHNEHLHRHLSNLHLGSKPKRITLKF